MRLLGIIFLIAAVAFILLGVFLKLAAFFFVSILTLIAAIVLFTILKKNQHNQTKSPLNKGLFLCLRIRQIPRSVKKYKGRNIAEGKRH